MDTKLRNRCAALFAFATVSIAQVSHASNFLECEVTAIVSQVLVESKENSEGVLLKINIVETKAINGSSPHDCKLEPRDRTVRVSPDATDTLSDVTAGNVVLLNYQYYSGMGEDGPVESETWTVAHVQE